MNEHIIMFIYFGKINNVIQLYLNIFVLNIIYITKYLNT